MKVSKKSCDKLGNKVCMESRNEPGKKEKPIGSKELGRKLCKKGSNVLAKKV